LALIRHDELMPVSIHQLLADHLAARIQGGHYPPGTRLPSVQDLEHEGLPIGAARDALRWLVRHGWADQQPDGSYTVAEEPQGDFDWAAVHAQVESVLSSWEGRPGNGTMLPVRPQLS
jgi:DNA-binding FadR family transcriptional regulator